MSIYRPVAGFDKPHQVSFDIEDIINGCTANEVAIRLAEIESNIRAVNEVSGEVTFSMGPNSLEVSWEPASTPCETVQNMGPTIQEKIARRKAVLKQKVTRNRERAASQLQVLENDDDPVPFPDADCR